MGKNVKEISPTSTITIDITIAVTGRFIKVSAIIEINLLSMQALSVNDEW
jgi:hypothetical protein